MAGQGDESDRCRHARQRQQQRHADGDECAEHEQEHEDRDRDRTLAGLLQLVGEHLGECLARTDRAGFAHVEAGVAVADFGDGRLDCVDLRFRGVVLAFHVPGHDDRAPVLRDLIAVLRIERGLEVLDRWISLDRAEDVVDRRPERWIGDGRARALHEHELRLRIRLGKAFLQDLVGFVRLADVCVLHVDVLRPDLHADRKRRDDEREPAKDRGLPVARAPAAHAGREVV